MNTEPKYWFNNMPKHWQIKRLKDNIIFQPNVAVPADNAFVTFMPMECLRDGVIQQREEIYSVIKKNGSYNAFENGDIVIAKVTPCFEHHNMAIAVNLKNGIGYGTSEIFVLRPKNINTPFLNYYLHSDYILGVGVSSMAGVGGLKRVNADVLKHAILILPPLAEQIKIANYLDNIISNIDAYVSERKKERLLLSDLKKAKVAEIVTKGLSPNIPLKDSGIPSIGMIPAHWEVRRLKELFEFGSGIPISKADLLETGIPVISYGQIHAKFNRGTKVEEQLLRYVDPSYLNTNPSSLVNKGDVIFADTSEDLEGCGNCVYIDKQMTLFAGYHTVILKCRKENPYLAYLFQSSNWREQIRKRVCGVKLYSITKTILNSVYIVLPPIEEQIQIVEYLDHECDQIEKKCALIDEQIQQLQLLKRALINEVVTGKKAI